MTTSVVVCTYNGEQFIREQIDSILKQSIIPDEIIIVDDCSSDDTVKIVKKISEKACDVKIDLAVNRVNVGVASNFLNAIKKANGDYIFLCDQDDIWLPNKIEIFMKYIERNQKLLYFSNGYLVDKERKRLKESLWNLMPFDIKWIEDKSVYDIMLNHSVVTGSAMAISRELVSYVRDVDVIPKGWIHDDFLGMIAASKDSICAINELTYEYRQHENNVIGAKRKNIVNKTKTVFINLKNNRNYHKEKFLKYSTFEPFCPESGKEKLLDTISFWKYICETDSSNKLKGIYYYITNKDKYNKYSTGVRAIIKDIVSLLLVKK